MTNKRLPSRWFGLAIVAFLFLSPAFLQGCDTFSTHEDHESEPSPEASQAKLRHAGLMDRALTYSNESASKGSATSASFANLVLGLQMYEADGVTRRVLNQYDVTRRILAKYGDNIELKVTVEAATNVFTVKINDIILEDFLADMATDPDIAWVEPDALFNFPDSGLLTQTEGSNQIIPWSLTRIGAGGTRSANHSAVHVFVLDSGVSNFDVELGEILDLTPLFENRYEGRRQKEGKDLSGHGTHIAGIIAANNNDKGILGIAGRATIHNIKVMTRDGLTDITTLLAAVDHVTTFKLDNPDTPVVVNLSLGADIGTTTYNALDEAIDASIEKGVVYVIAAGNNSMDAATYSPAHVEAAITVGAYDADDAFAWFSNYGPVVDILAPGDMILSNPYQRADRDSNTFILRSGTSHAAPHVAGAAARYLLGHPDATPAEVHRAILDAASAEISDAPVATTNLTVMMGDWRPRQR